jgi:hypothetical protein
MAKKRYTKLEEEIIQILNEKERGPDWRSRLRLVRRPRLGPRAAPRPRTGSFKLDMAGIGWFAGSFALALLAIIAAGYSHLLAGLLAISCILFFLSPVVFNRRTGPPRRTAQRWRGRDIELPPSRAGVLGDLRYRLWQYRHRR